MIKTLLAFFAATLAAQAQILSPIIYGPSPVPPSITFVSGQKLVALSTTGNSSPSSASLPSPATVGNVVFYGANGYLGPATTSFLAGDNQTPPNTYAQDKQQTGSTDTNVYASLGHASITSTSTPFTVSSTPDAGTFAYSGIVAAEFNGLTGNGVPDSLDSAGGSGTAVTCGTVTTTVANELVVVSVQSYGTTISPGSGSGLTVIAQTSPDTLAIGLAYRTVPTPGPYSPTLTLSSSGVWACTAGAYK